jgi:hypothetical protein
MSAVAGTYNCLVKSPLGDQKSLLTIADNGDGTWTGSNVGDQGTLECYECKVDGNTLSWKSDMKVPMPMTLEMTATVDGDALDGSVKAGMFGSFPMSGTRA